MGDERASIQVPVESALVAIKAEDVETLPDLLADADSDELRHLSNELRGEIESYSGDPLAKRVYIEDILFRAYFLRRMSDDQYGLREEPEEKEVHKSIKDIEPEETNGGGIKEAVVEKRSVNIKEAMANINGNGGRQ